MTKVSKRYENNHKRWKDFGKKRSKEEGFVESCVYVLVELKYELCWAELSWSICWRYSTGATIHVFTVLKYETPNATSWQIMSNERFTTTNKICIWHHAKPTTNTFVHRCKLPFLHQPHFPTFKNLNLFILFLGEDLWWERDG